MYIAVVVYVTIPPGLTRCFSKPPFGQPQLHTKKHKSGYKNRGNVTIWWKNHPVGFMLRAWLHLITFSIKILSNLHVEIW